MVEQGFGSMEPQKLKIENKEKKDNKIEAYYNWDKLEYNEDFKNKVEELDEKGVLNMMDFVKIASIGSEKGWLYIPDFVLSEIDNHIEKQINSEDLNWSIRDVYIDENQIMINVDTEDEEGFQGVGGYYLDLNTLELTGAHGHAPLENDGNQYPRKREFKNEDGGID